MKTKRFRCYDFINHIVLNDFQKKASLNLILTLNKPQININL